VRKGALPGILAFLAGLGAAAAAYGVGETWRATSEDAFCSRCHEMEPYIAAWKAGPHGKISCKVCHMGKGPAGAISAKARGLVFLAAHRAGDSGSPQAVVPDRTCKSLDCHPEGGGDGLPWKGMLFHHSLHEKTGRKALGEGAGCTLCHGKTLSRGHGTEVREEACLACHLTAGGIRPRGSAGREDSACLACHPIPPAVKLARGARLDHAGARAGGYGCRDCHPSFFPQGPPVERKACLACHAVAGEDPSWPPAWEAGRIHQVHLRKASFSCSRCHRPFAHRLPSPWLSSRGGKCPHASGRKKDGSPRAFVRVDCRFCHEGVGGGPLRRGRCGLCHEEKK